MPKVNHISGSGFVFEDKRSTVVVRCKRRLVPMAELEYLRETRETAGGKIAGVRRLSGDGRELHLITVEVPGRGARVVTFDAGPAFLGYFRNFAEALMLIIYGLAAMVAVGTLGYLVLSLVAG